jgi:hypothetical protein
MLLREKLEAEGKEAHDLFDSNAISPGTKFMFDLNKQLAFFVQYKLNTDPLYQNVSPQNLLLTLFSLSESFCQTEAFQEKVSTR